MVQQVTAGQKANGSAQIGKGLCLHFGFRPNFTLLSFARLENPGNQNIQMGVKLVAR